MNADWQPPTLDKIRKAFNDRPSSYTAADTAPIPPPRLTQAQPNSEKLDLEPLLFDHKDTLESFRLSVTFYYLRAKPWYVATEYSNVTRNNFIAREFATESACKDYVEYCVGIVESQGFVLKREQLSTYTQRAITGAMAAPGQSSLQQPKRKLVV